MKYSRELFNTYIRLNYALDHAQIHSLALKTEYKYETMDGQDIPGKGSHYQLNKYENCNRG